MWGDLFPHEPKKPAVRRFIPQSAEQLDVKSREKDQDQVRIPSGQQNNKKKNRSLRRKGKYEKEKREERVGSLIDQTSHFSETIDFSE
jgi:hypothetical protein